MDTATDPTAFIHQVMPLCEQFGVVARTLEPDQVVLTMPFDPRWCTVGGRLHGGAMMALADSAGATVAFLNLPTGATGTTTVASTTSLVGGVTDGDVEATATVVHAGRTTIVVDTVVRNGDRVVARTTQTQLVLT